ncbi:MAG: tyrosine-type recombinase/integrase [Acidobacteriota bacterium]
MKPTEFRFQGPFASQTAAFAVHMERTGGHHVTLFLTLARLDRFLTLHHPTIAHLSRDVVREWFASFSGLKRSAQDRYRSATFQFCKYLRRDDPLTACPEDFVPLRRDRSFRPHIYSVQEVARLLDEARRQPPSPSRLRPWTLELIVALLYSAGLRIGEVVRLDVGDYDRLEGTLLIRETKFEKTRLVPLASSTRRLVDAYFERRGVLGFDMGPATPLIWPLAGSRPKRACLGSVQQALTQLMRQCGIKPPKGRGPRIHDMRHTFAAHRVLAWYRSGVDVQSRLPHLATYMGHRGIESTQVYLTVIPGVLEEASSRLAHFAASAFVERQDGHEQE